MTFKEQKDLDKGKKTSGKYKEIKAKNIILLRCKLHQ